MSKVYKSIRQDLRLEPKPNNKWTNIIIWFIIVLCVLSLFSCTTPSITTYQQGTCIGDRAEIRETLNLNERVWYVDCKCDSGEKVIIKRKLK